MKKVKHIIALLIKKKIEEQRAKRDDIMTHDVNKSQYRMIRKLIRSIYGLFEII